MRTLVHLDTERIRQIFKRRGIRSCAFSQLCNRGTEFTSRLLRTGYVTLETARNVAEVLGVGVDELILHPWNVRINSPQIKGELKFREWRYCDFAEMIYMSYEGFRSTLCDRKTSYETARRIAEVLKIPLEEILEDVPD